MNPAETDQSSTSAVSGKLVIVGILTVALIAAGASWWFRYNATHRAAGFWGAQAARLISNSATIKLQHIDRGATGSPTTTITREVTNARGITHLRTALLEDKSFVWPASSAEPPAHSAWCLTFVGESPNDRTWIWFTPDLNYVWRGVSDTELRTVSCAPISSGLLELFTEMMAGPAAAGPPGPAPPAEPAR
jgi:hypothetical protein